MTEENSRAGAFPLEWLHYAKTLGLEADLLPVVCDDTVSIHPQSKIRSLGKTPTKLTSGGLVVGIPKWPEFVATKADIQSWAKQESYGICLNSRNVRGIDIDIPDVDRANKVVEEVKAFSGIDMPIRRREGTGKCLMMVRVGGLIPKDSIITEGGVIERLGNGQQFILSGDHFARGVKTGTRYEILGGLPSEIPELPIDQFLALWGHLVRTLSVIAEESEDTFTARRVGETVVVADPVAEYILGGGYPVINDRVGAIDISCPWVDGHSGKTDDTESQWLKAGTNGYATGHFKCMHGSCKGNTRDDFLQAIGYATHGLVCIEDTLSNQPVSPSFARDDHGAIKSTLANVNLALSSPEWLGFEVQYDDFLGELYCTDLKKGTVKPFSDSDYVAIRTRLELLGFKTVTANMMSDCVCLRSSENTIDSAQVWLASLVWDGVPRIDSFTHKYISGEDSEYSTAVGRYMWSAMAGRVITPGVQADMVPIWISRRQGRGKTSALRLLAPGEDRYATIDLSQPDDNIARIMRGKLVCELGELKGLSSRDWSSLNDFITRKKDTWVPKFKEFSTSYARRSIFIGTCNIDTPLSDPTGSRRWLPVRLEGFVDVDAITRDRDQLWAEAAVLYRLSGVCYQDAERLAALIHTGYKTVDPWADVLLDWIMAAGTNGVSPMMLPVVSLAKLAEEALGLTPKDLTNKTHNRIDNILRGYGLIYDAASRGWIPEEDA